jgi:outer membrane protein, heavy metal efflux system
MKSLRSFLVFFVFAFLNLSEAFPQLLLTRPAAVDSAFKNNPGIIASLKQVERQQALKRGSFILDKTELWMEAPTSIRFALGVQQNFSFPTVYINEVKLQKENVKLAEKELSINKNALAKNIETLYLEIQYTSARVAQLQYQDSIYGRLLKATEKRYSLGEVEFLEKVLEETQYHGTNNLLQQAYKERESLQEQILLLTGVMTDSLQVEAFSKYPLIDYTRKDTSFLLRNPSIGYYSHNRMVSQRILKVQRSNYLPNIFAGYLNQGFSNSEILYRFKFGISLPLWFPAYTSRIKAARIGIDIADYQYQAAINSIRVEYYKAYSDYDKNRLNLEYYENKALKQADEIIRTSTRLYSVGEISYFNHLSGLAQGMDIKIRYLNALKEYNQSIINLNYLRGE